LTIFKGQKTFSYELNLCIKHAKIALLIMQILIGGENETRNDDGNRRAQSPVRFGLRTGGPRDMFGFVQQQWNGCDLQRDNINRRRMQLASRHRWNQLHALCGLGEGAIETPGDAGDP
jgi:hypothetical protein